MRLRKPCEHGRYDGHPYAVEPVDMDTDLGHWCPGGEFLVDDALVIEKVGGEWPKSATEALKSVLWNGKGYTFKTLLDALTVREAAR